MYRRYLFARARLSITMVSLAANFTVDNVTHPLGQCIRVALDSYEVRIRIRLTCLTISYLSKKQQAHDHGYARVLF